MKYKLKKGDEVVVIAGSHKGERGQIISVLRDSCRVVVEGVGLVKRYLKKSQKNPEGGVVEIESSIHYSNVMKADRYDAKHSA